MKRHLPCLIACLWVFSAAVACGQSDQTQPLPPPDGEPLPVIPKDNLPLGARVDLFQPKPISEVRLDPRPGDHPAPDGTTQLTSNRRFGDLRELRMEQGWTPRGLQWRASNFAHRPLYFEDVLLERHGQRRRHGTQPLWSAAHFFGTLPILPYKMGLDCPWDCVYSLGYQRPGSCKPSYRRRAVWEMDAAALEGGAWVGALLLLP